MNLKSTHDATIDRDLFVLVVAIGLALSLNVPGMMAWVEQHLPPSLPLRIVVYALLLTSGGVIGLLARRIAERIAAWRDQG